MSARDEAHLEDADLLQVSKHRRSRSHDASMAKRSPLILICLLHMSSLLNLQFVSRISIWEAAYTCRLCMRKAYRAGH